MSLGCATPERLPVQRPTSTVSASSKRITYIPRCNLMPGLSKPPSILENLLSATKMQLRGCLKNILSASMLWAVTGQAICVAPGSAVEPRWKVVACIVDQTMHPVRKAARTYSGEVHTGTTLAVASEQTICVLGEAKRTGAHTSMRHSQRWQHVSGPGNRRVALPYCQQRDSHSASSPLPISRHHLPIVP